MRVTWSRDDDCTGTGDVMRAGLLDVMRSGLLVVMRSGLLVVLVACGSAPARSTASNHVVDNAQPVTHLRVLVLPEYHRGCPRPHHVTLTVDGDVRVKVIAPCKDPPIPNGNGSVIVDSSPVVVRVPPFDIPAGRHHLVARDAETGKSMAIDLDFPHYDHEDNGTFRPVVETFPIDLGDDRIKIAAPVYEIMIM